MGGVTQREPSRFEIDSRAADKKRVSTLVTEDPSGVQPRCELTTPTLTTLEWALSSEKLELSETALRKMPEMIDAPAAPGARLREAANGAVVRTGTLAGAVERGLTIRGAHGERSSAAVFEPESLALTDPLAGRPGGTTERTGRLVEYALTLIRASRRSSSNAPQAA